MYSIYLETVKRCHKKALLKQGKRGGKQADHSTTTAAGNKEEIQKLEVPAADQSLDHPHPSLVRRTILTPFPGSSSCNSNHRKSLTKVDSTRTAETELLSDDEEDADADADDQHHTLAGGEQEEFDWETFINDSYYSDGSNGNSSGSVFSYSVDAEQGTPKNHNGDGEALVVDCCPVKPSRTAVEGEGSFSFSDDSDEDYSLSLHSLSSEDNDLQHPSMIQVSPGGLQVVPFRGSSETINMATEKKNRHCIITSTHCGCCEQVLYCGHDITHVLCSQCQVVSLVNSTVERPRPAVGVGWTEEEFSRHLDQQWRRSSSSSNSSSSPQSSFSSFFLTMPPLI